MRVEEVAAGRAARTDGDTAAVRSAGVDTVDSEAMVDIAPALLGTDGSGAVYTGPMFMKVLCMRKRLNNALTT